jgi:hypothetical protein
LEVFSPAPEQLRNIVQNAYNDRPVTVCLSDLTPDRSRDKEAAQMNQNPVMER